MVTCRVFIQFGILFFRLLLFLIALEVVQAKSDCEKPNHPGKYDAIIDIGDVAQIAEEERIQVDFPSSQTDNFTKGENVRVFGILGLYNKGKTWFINRLFGTEFGSGTLHTTVGLSLKYFPRMKGCWKSHWLVLDSAGTQSPVGYQDIAENITVQKRKEVELGRAARRIMTERFIFDVVCYTSDVIVFLVNDLTWIEQRDIFAVQQIFQKKRNQETEKTGKQKDDRSVIVVHNYKSTAETSTAFQLFRQQVIQKYNGTQFHDAGDQKDDLTYVHKRDKGWIWHFGFLWEEKAEAPGYFSSPKRSAAQQVNDKSIAVLSNVLDKVKVTNDFSFSETFSRILAGSLEKFVSIQADSTNDKLEEIDHARLTLRYESAANQFVVNDADKLKLHLSKKGDFNEFNQIEITESTGHFSVSEISTYDLSPAYGDYTMMRVFQVELPGVKREDLRFSYHDKGWYVHVRRKPHPNFQEGHTDSRSGKAVIPLNFDDTLENERKEIMWEDFNPVANASLRCLRNIKKERKLYCSPVRLKDGILYVTAKVKQPYDEASKQRRRRHIEWF